MHSQACHWQHPNGCYYGEWLRVVGYFHSYFGESGNTWYTGQSTVSSWIAQVWKNGFRVHDIPWLQLLGLLQPHLTNLQEPDWMGAMDWIPKWQLWSPCWRSWWWWDWGHEQDMEGDEDLDQTSRCGACGMVTQLCHRLSCCYFHCLHQ